MRKILLIITFLAVAGSAFADNDTLVEPMPVFDSAQVFTDAEWQALTEKIDSISQAASVQIRIYTTTNLQGFSADSFAQRLGEGWTGPNGFDNGIVIVYQPETENNHFEAAIKAGQGFGQLIPDTVGKRIVEQQMMPFLSDGLAFNGISKAVDACFSLVQGNSQVAENITNERFSKEDITVLFLFIAFWVAMLILARSTIRDNHYTTAGRASGGSWTGEYIGRFGGSGASGKW